MGDDMATAAFDNATLGTFRVGSGAHASPVIVDGGGDARVVIVSSDAPLAVGSRFEFAGLTWEIVRAQDLIRGFVAWPLRRNLRG